MGGGGKGGSKQTIYDYYMSLDYGVCHGPLDAYNEIVIKDKTAFVGPITADGAISVSKKKLFGGDDGEGGPVGIVEFYMGSYVQKMSSSLANRFGLTPDTAPGYRGLAHVFFRGGTLTDGTDTNGGTAEAPVTGFNGFGSIFQNLLSSSSGSSGKAGFRWTSNNPYMPSTSIRATRGSVGLSYDKYIWPITGVDDNGDYTIAASGDAFATSGEVDKTKLPDANPAGIIYEALVNADWGKGELTSTIDIDSFEAAAAILNGEHFGLSLKWMREDTIENFIGEILDHIKGVLFEHPSTGMWTLVLIRGGYDTSDIPSLSPSNADVTSIKTRLWGETINQIVVSYTDPESEETETVTSMNLANIAIQGGVRSEERDYHGIRNPYLALWVADRDVAESSRTLTSATVLVDRTGFDILPGSVLYFTWPEESITNMICRVMKIDYGNSKDRTIKLDIVQDIFASPPIVTNSVPQDPLYETVPTPEDVDQVLIMGVPLPPLIASGADVDALDAEYPASDIMFLANQSDFTPLDITVEGDVVRSNGATEVDTLRTFLPTPFDALGETWVPEVRSTIAGDVIDQMTGYDPTIGDIFVIGSTEAGHELVMLDTYNGGTDEWTVIRGLYDTVPQNWADTALIWRFEESNENVSPQAPTAGVDEDYTFLMRTEAGQLASADATPITHTPTARLHLPFRPANVSIDGNGFGHTAYTSAPTPSTITLTWENRNRLTEDAVATAWDDGDVTPEVGQTTTIRFRDASVANTLEHEVTGLTGTSHVFDLSDLSDYRHYTVEFLAVRDGLESYRAATATLEVAHFGWGNNFGYDYNESDG